MDVEVSAYQPEKAKFGIRRSRGGIIEADIVLVGEECLHVPSIYRLLKDVRWPEGVEVAFYDLGE